jgi:pimeloyl-ACP methyl ester carboxylesterase
MDDSQSVSDQHPRATRHTAGRCTGRAFTRTDRVVRSRTIAAAMLAVVSALSLLCACVTRNRLPEGSAGFQAADCPDPNYPGVPDANLGPNYSCGYLTVPENRRAPNGRTIRILVARVKAATNAPRPDPIVFLAGGPGGAGTLSAPAVVAGGMNAERDVIFVNQRGTLHSDPHLSCREMDDFAAQSIGLIYEAASTAALDAAGVTTCRERIAPSGADLAAYNTRENAADIADLRVALGIEWWNVYGVSYGSDLALQLLRDHPEGIRSVVLDSVVPPNQNIVDKWWAAPASGLEAIFAACAAQPACAAAYPNLATDFTTTVNRLSATPAEITVGDPSGQPVRVTIDGFKLFPVMLAWSASVTQVIDIPRLIDNLANGDGTLAAAAIVATNDLPEDERGLLGSGLALGAYCQEMANWTDAERALSEARIAMPAIAEPVLRIAPTGSWLFDECRAWGLGRSDPATLATAISKVPTLILAGTFDSNTAPAWVEQVTPGLSNAVVLHFPGVGHGVLPTSHCAQTIMTEFLDDPHSAVDSSCIAQTTIPTFTTFKSDSATPRRTSDVEWTHGIDRLATHVLGVNTATLGIIPALREQPLVE